MTLGLELFGAFVAGVGFTLIMLALFAGRLSKWAMRRMLQKSVFANKPATEPNVRYDTITEVWTLPETTDPNPRS